MEPAGGDPGQRHQAQAGGGVPAEATARRRASPAAPVAATVAPVPEPRDRAAERRLQAAVVVRRRRRRRR